MKRAITSRLPRTVDDITAPIIILQDSYIDTIELNPEEILIPKEVKDAAGNVTRVEIDEHNVSQLQSSLLNPDWSVQLIIIEEIPPVEIDGKTYKYKLVAGFHRLTALIKNHENKWWFDLYNFKSEEDRLECQKIENDHKPRKGHDVKGLTNLLAYKVYKKMIKNTKQAMDEELSVLKNVHANTKTAAVRAAIGRTGAYVDTIVRTFDDIRKLLSNPDRYPSGVTEYHHSGDLDVKRDMHGWTVGEGYEDEYIFSAIKKFHETGKHSYFTNHVKAANKDKSISQRRSNMLNKYAHYEEALKTVIKYYNENGQTFPWKYDEAFHPQNNIIGQEERKFI